MNQTITFRLAVEDDIAEISRVLAASWRTAYRGIINNNYLDHIPDNHWVLFLRAGIPQGTVRCMVAQKDDNIIGAAILRKSMIEPFPKDGELVSFYLLPQFIGQGIGHQFYEKVEIDFLRQGYTHAVLDVLEENDKAIQFYLSHGYVDTAHTTNIAIQSQNLKCKVLRKAL